MYNNLICHVCLDTHVSYKIFKTTTSIFNIIVISEQTGMRDERKVNEALINVCIGLKNKHTTICLV